MDVPISFDSFVEGLLHQNLHPNKRQRLGTYDGETGRYNVDFSAPLYQDVLLLSKIFMEVIGDHNSFDGEADPAQLAALVKSLVAKSREYTRTKSDEALEEMANEIRQMTDPTMIRDVARVFNELLRLSTLAEKQHRIRRWNAYRRGQGEIVLRHTYDDAFNTLLSSGFKPEDIRKALLSQQVELVLTAHPTQAVRRTLLEKQTK